MSEAHDLSQLPDSELMAIELGDGALLNDLALRIGKLKSELR